MMCCFSSRVLAFSWRLSPQATRLTSRVLSSSTTTTSEESQQQTPWNVPAARRKKDARVRQHVNPLARKYQQPTILPPDWPKNVFENTNLPLFLDIGCAKGGFLLEMAAQVTNQNYLGLEIRPAVVQQALDRVEKHGLNGRLTFCGCNANVDLDRILSLYDQGPLETVAIQFPDPHFKSQHAKRRVVTPSLVKTLAKHMPESSRLFLQSDVKEVLDDMRLRFREEEDYFQDQVEDIARYLAENPLGIQTERERSVLKRDLPVYRALFSRTGAEFCEEIDENQG